MKLTIQPQAALCDEELNIIVSELPPFAEVTITASMHLPWAENTVFESHAAFLADASGCVDLSSQAPVSGTYQDVCAMGLIESMKLSAGKVKDIVKNISVDQSMQINFTAESVGSNSCASVERLFVSPEVKRRKVCDEFVGELFYWENKSCKTVVVLGGSDGNSAALSLISVLLASHGFTVLSLAYFNEKGLPKALAQVPLEYFEKVFCWLEENEITRSGELYLHGTSKGGELALLLASRYPFIKKVAAFAPHGYCFQGINYKNVSSWTYGGNNVPFIRIRNSYVLKELAGSIVKNRPFGYTGAYKKALKSAVNKEEARIKIEQGKAELLLIAGKMDNIWNSWGGCTDIMDALERCDYQFSRKFLPYDDAGHAFPLPYMIPAAVLQSMKVAPRLVFDIGGTAEANSRMQADSWKKTIEFFEEGI